MRTVICSGRFRQLPRLKQKTMSLVNNELSGLGCSCLLASES
uniref:Uncharacterized protein n=1 Tax=Anguilla anguilla TaxID=7936 RepID=A0A0E9T1Y3_ANGAN